MNHDLDKFRVWAIANKLTVNPYKSHGLIISLKCSDNMKSFNDIALKGGESSSQFQWFTKAKIEL